MIRLRPENETLLLEIPSPPLSKLYGSVLQSFVGERSPEFKRIAKGVEIRNKLIHRPFEQPIDEQVAIDYVEAIARAIFHLLSLLYPDDEVAQQLYHPPFVGQIVSPPPSS